MFTGIIEEVGVVQALRKGVASAVITIAGQRIFEDLRLGDSVAVNGVCLTVSAFTQAQFDADVMHETLKRTGLGTLQKGSRVNLERAMPANGRFGGHIVSGHIDGLGKITDIRKDDNAFWYTINAPAHIMKYIVEKGSVAIDGISLTVATVTESSFSVSVIPHTAKETIISERQKSDQVNLENDIVGKYIEKLLTQKEAPKGVSREFLAKHGF